MEEYRCVASAPYLRVTTNGDAQFFDPVVEVNVVNLVHYSTPAEQNMHWYYKVRLNNGEVHFHSIKRLVAEAFLCPDVGKDRHIHVNLIDGDPYNVELSNMSLSAGGERKRCNIKCQIDGNMFDSASAAAEWIARQLHYRFKPVTLTKYIRMGKPYVKGFSVWYY